MDIAGPAINAIADSEGLPVVNREICKRRMSPRRTCRASKKATRATLEHIQMYKSTGTQLQRIKWLNPAHNDYSTGDNKMEEGMAIRMSSRFSFSVHGRRTIARQRVSKMVLAQTRPSGPYKRYCCGKKSAVHSINPAGQRRPLFTCFRVS